MDVEEVVAVVAADTDVGSSVVSLVNSIVVELDKIGGKGSGALADTLSAKANDLADAVVANTTAVDEPVVDPTNPTGVKRTADGQPLEEIDVSGASNEPDDQPS